MKWLDNVRVIVDKKEYKDKGVYKGAIGTIIFAWIRENKFEVVFSDPNGTDYADLMINISDLELVQDNHLTDKEIIKDLPKNDPHWWCKVENGYILNLVGEKKNQIPYNYDS